MIITIVNQSKLTDAEIRKAVTALNKQLTRDFLPWWGITGRIQYPATKNGPDPDIQDQAVVYLRSTVDVDGVLGYHDANWYGVPYGVVYTDLSKQLGEPWSVTLSHEILELLGDPQANLLVMGSHPTKKTLVFHWFEMCDAVQSDMYDIDGIKVSNFVLPTYFTPQDGEGRNDFMNKGLKSFNVRPGGYVGFYDPRTGQMGSYMASRDAAAKGRQSVKSAASLVRRANRYAMKITSPK